MFKIQGENYNKNIIEEDLIVTFLLEENKNFIENDFNIYTDKIIFFKNVGFSFYLKDDLIKFVKAKSILISYKTEFNVYKIIYDKEIKELEDNDIDFNTTNIYIRYSNHISVIKEDLKDKYDKKFNINEKVVPNNILIPIPSEIENIETFSSILGKSLMNLVLKKEKSKEEIIDFVSNLFNMICYDVVEKIDDSLYIIELKHNKDHLTKLGMNVENIIYKSYVKKEDLYSLENIINDINEMYDWHNRE